MKGIVGQLDVVILEARNLGGGTAQRPCNEWFIRILFELGLIVYCRLYCPIWKEWICNKRRRGNESNMESWGCIVKRFFINKILKIQNQYIELNNN